MNTMQRSINWLTVRLFPIYGAMLFAIRYDTVDPTGFTSLKSKYPL
jgi:hypothetical protein